MEVDHQPETVDFSVATLDESGRLPPGFHIFWGSRIAWFEPRDDLPRHEMTFYHKQSCSTAAPNWPGPYTEIETGISHGVRLFFPVQLDAHRIVAVIDTGAQFTHLSTSMARKLGISEAVLARDRTVTLHDAAGAVLTSRVHRFATLEIGGIIIRYPEINVTDLTLTEADIVLGVDFLNSRRLWLSYGSRRIFLFK